MIFFDVDDNARIFDDFPLYFFFYYLTKNQNSLTMIVSFSQPFWESF